MNTTIGYSICFLVFLCMIGCILIDEKSYGQGGVPDAIVPTSSEKPIVWFVHGMVSIRDSFDEEIKVLREIYPQAEEVRLITWNSPKMSISQMGVAWSLSLENSQAFVPEFVKQIQDLPPEKQKKLILVGHSLGANIVIRSGAILASKGIQLRQIIFAGAAINNDDPDIAKALNASRQTVISIINFNDVLLAAYKIGAEFHSALGTGYLYPVEKSKFREIVLEGTVEHYGYKYFQRLKTSVATGDYSYNGIIVPQDFSQIYFPTIGGPVWWDVLDECHGWLLQHNQATGHVRILDPNGFRRAWGRKNVMKIAFDRVKQQLNEKNKVVYVNSNDINVPQEWINWDRTTWGGKVWWSNLDEYKGWKLQQNNWTGHCRILDQADIRRAWGTESEMRKSFVVVKKQLK